MEDNISEALKKIHPELKLIFTNNQEKIEVVSLSEFLKSRFPEAFTRFGNNQVLSFHIWCGNEIILGMQILEFYPCCGKIIGRRLEARDSFFLKNELISLTDKMDELTTLLMSLLEIVLKHCKYSSMTFIVSVEENPLFYKLIKKINVYKEVNSFKNERMTKKNLCIEFCRNFW